MKTVIVFRHGKSDWGANFDHDHERPVAPRGIKASKAMGKWLARTDQIPDFCVVSSALRTRQTYAYASEAGEWRSEMTVEDALYDSTVSTYLEVIRRLPIDAERALLVGHEPTCSGITSLLAGRTDIRFPTATMARLDLDVDSWDQVEGESGTLIWLQPPRFL